MKVEIQNLYDNTYECDDCGGGVGAHGYRIFVDGIQVIERTPFDHCCSPVTYDQGDLAKDLLEYVAQLKNVEIGFRDTEGYE